MTGRVFDWDAEKAASNVRKHGVSFEEAKTVFDDPHLIVEFDTKHSHGAEDRFLGIGMSSRLRVLAVTFTERDETIRLISARRATKAEVGRYAGQS